MENCYTPLHFIVRLDTATWIALVLYPSDESNQRHFGHAGWLQPCPPGKGDTFVADAASIAGIRTSQSEF